MSAGVAVKQEIIEGDEALIDQKGSSVSLLGKRALLDSEHTVCTEKKRCMQFWKAGDYGDDHPPNPRSTGGEMDHVRVHPRFLHSNATSHKWALGAFAELLDNSLDEVRTGASYVTVDMLINKSDNNNSKMLLVQDNGGGMTPDTMRQCMSLGYSQKSKLANTIGQYGNGFKTSTMRLGADVIVFSKSKSKGKGLDATKSVGLLSYTFLKATGMQDIVVPIIDFQKKGEQEWERTIRSSSKDWCTNLDTITTWSPYKTQSQLLQQFDFLEEQGTRIVIYNLWEDDQGQLELDFDQDIHDIQIRGVNRDDKKIQLAQQFPNAAHFLTYRHSLRSYAAILYLRLPQGFRIILRGKELVNHNLINDMTHTIQHTYKPQLITHLPTAPSQMSAVITVGFARDAESHINIQGFNVYHKNRLIKPFWRIWNAAGSDGRGVIGVLEADFIEPAHDKQGFERSISLSRLEARLLKLHKDYWRDNCQKIGYAPRRLQKKTVTMKLPPSNEEEEEIRKQNTELKIRLLQVDDESKKAELRRLLQYERDVCKSIENQLVKVAEKIEEMNMEKESLINLFNEEREKRDIEEANLKDQINIASTTIQELLDKVKQLDAS